MGMIRPDHAGGRMAAIHAAFVPKDAMSTTTPDESPLQRTAGLVVAAEAAFLGGPRAHAVPDIGSSTPLFGVALCGIPADYLAVIPNMTWEQVDPGRRCAHCQTP